VEEAVVAVMVAVGVVAISTFSQIVQSVRSI